MTENISKSEKKMEETLVTYTEQGFLLRKKKHKAEMDLHQALDKYVGITPER